MNVIDIGIILIIISFLAMGSKNGAIREAFSFIGTILMFVVSYMLKGIVGHYICIYFPFISFHGSLEGISTFNIFMYEIIAFILTFAILLGFYAIIVKGSELVQKLVNMTIILKLPSMIIGAIISGVKCWLLLFFALLIASLTLGSKPMFQESKLANLILYKTPMVSSYASPLTNSMKEVYEVVEEIQKDDSKTKAEKTQKQKTANAKCLDIMLKYKIVDKDTVEECIELEKIKKEKEITDVLNNYE